jgi:hypothetical protein
MPKCTVTIDAHGTRRMIYSSRWTPILMPRAIPARASHVEPDTNIPGQWTVDLTPVSGPIVPGFATRDEGLKFEVNWIEQNWLKEKLNNAPI